MDDNLYAIVKIDGKTLPDQLILTFRKPYGKISMGWSRAVRLAGNRVLMDRCQLFNTAPGQPDSSDMAMLERIETDACPVTRIQFLHGHMAVMYEVEKDGTARRIP